MRALYAVKLEAEKRFVEVVGVAVLGSPIARQRMR